jgi:transposase
MAKTFREWDLGQRRLFPPSVQELVPEGHLAHFVRDTVREHLDLEAILATYQEERGYPPYHPTMMTALLLYAYAQGVYSSRKIARSCEERIDFMAVTGMQKPDFRTISDFRKRHLTALAGLFGQVLKLCQKAGLVKLGHVALDGTKIKANASRHKAMSYGRMAAAEESLQQEVRAWMQRADEQDRDEDRRFGREKRGDELPDWVKNKQERIKRIQAAKQALEAEAKAEAPAAADDSKNKPKAKKQRNFTDPDSRIMKTKDGFEQAYNGQAAVEAGSQVIVAATLTNTQNDGPLLTEMLHQIRANTGRQAQEVSADSGYCTVENLRTLSQCKIDAYVATGRQKHGDAAATKDARSPAKWVQRMTAKLRRGGWRSRYRLRKVTVEPVFGQIKEARGFRRFLMRGLAKVSAEWQLICAVHNLRKLAVVRG